MPSKKEKAGADIKRLLEEMDAYTNMKFDFVFRAFYFLHLMVARAHIAADSLTRILH